MCMYIGNLIIEVHCVSQHVTHMSLRKFYSSAVTFHHEGEEEGQTGAEDKNGATIREFRGG